MHKRWAYRRPAALQSPFRLPAGNPGNQMRLHASVPGAWTFLRASKSNLRCQTSKPTNRLLCRHNLPKRSRASVQRLWRCGIRVCHLRGRLVQATCKVAFHDAFLVAPRLTSHLGVNESGMFRYLSCWPSSEATAIQKRSRIASGNGDVLSLSFYSLVFWLFVVAAQANPRDSVRCRGRHA